MTTTIRVSEATRDAVNRLRAQTGQSTDSLLEQALAAYEESMFWRRWQEVYVDGGGDVTDGEELRLWDRASAADFAAQQAAESDEAR